MAIRDDEVLNISVPPMTRLEAVYVPEVVKGFGTTLRHLFTSFGQSKPAALLGMKKTTRAMQYPEERREHLPVEEGGLHAPNFRGFHRLNRDEQGRVKCVACMMCPTICPARCIHIEAAESPWDDREKYPKKFEIDELRCIFCGMCEEACPVDAIELTTEYDIVGRSRQEMIFDKEKLLHVYDVTINKKPM
ncbi:MAG: NADH-quinone oxidoreductase subunit I [Planctomycetota bacterium]|jgi:NADH-quinone oxidoreductase subunit I|nr:NADH-quinone oxidoreductase subunit I [Planctomycetota bacterium]